MQHYYKNHGAVAGAGAGAVAGAGAGAGAVAGAVAGAGAGAVSGAVAGAGAGENEKPTATTNSVCCFVFIRSTLDFYIHINWLCFTDQVQKRVPTSRGEVQTSMSDRRRVGVLMSFHVPRYYIKKHPVLGIGEGNNGFFVFEREGLTYYVIASDGEGWEHVSVSLNKNRTPTWKQMCIVKDIFWDKEDCVIQYHPPEIASLFNFASSEYVNNHPYVLHLWRPIDKEIPMPKSILVGIK